MADSELDEIERGWKLLNEQKEEEALKIVAGIEKKEDLSLKEKLAIQRLKARIHFSLGHFEEAFKIAEKTYQEYDSVGNDYLLIDVINLKLMFSSWQGQILNKSSRNLMERVEILLKSISNRSPSEMAIIKVPFLNFKGMYYYLKGDYNLARECCKRALEIIDQFKIQRLDDLNYRRNILNLMGHIYTGKGELDQALEYFEKSLALKITDTVHEKILESIDLRGMGFIFFVKGDLDNSLKFLKESLTILEDLNLLVKGAPESCATLNGIIRVMTAKGDNEGTQHYLQLFKQINDKNPIKANIANYNLLRAKALKSSTRSRDRVEAENIYKEIIEKEKKQYFLVNNALIEICDLYLKELKLTSDLTIIDEINPYISRLQENAEKGNAYQILAKSNLLKAKVALIQMNMGDARRFLIQAQQIADEHGYTHLAQTISIEHDNLLGVLDVWENFQKTNAPASKRINLALPSDSIKTIIEAQEGKMPEVLEEEPVLLLLIIEGGVLLLSYPFTDDWKRDSELLGSFLTAFMSFSNEYFAEGLDRVKFGQYTVLMETISKFTICYLYKGQTYLAKKKVEYLIHRLQNSPTIMQVLDKYYETSQVIELKDFPFLESFLTEIFMSKNPVHTKT
ncbi:MAG: tetratricopeptide repeat protein [Promethearchaeota archaeon]